MLVRYTWRKGTGVKGRTNLLQSLSPSILAMKLFARLSVISAKLIFLYLYINILPQPSDIHERKYYSLLYFFEQFTVYYFYTFVNLNQRKEAKYKLVSSIKYYNKLDLTLFSNESTHFVKILLAPSSAILNHLRWLN